MRSFEQINTFLKRPDYVCARALTANVAEQITVPAGAAFVVFGANVDFFAAYGANPTAVVPGADVDDGTSNEMNPISRVVAGDAKISVISASNGILTASFWKQSL